MKNYILLLSFIFLFVLTSCKKNDNTSGPSGPSPASSPDISTSNFVQTPDGGDPRGTYAPNSPVFNIFLNSIPNATVIQQYTSDTGGGTIKLSGSSSNNGTYTANNLTINVNGKISIYQGKDSTIIPISFPNAFGSGSGSWSVIAKGVMVLDNADTVQYAVNTKGIFLQYPVIDNGTNYGTAVLALKK